MSALLKNISSLEGWTPASYKRTTNTQKETQAVHLDPVAVSALAVMALISQDLHNKPPLLSLLSSCCAYCCSWEWCRDFPTTLMGADTELSSLVFTIHYDNKTPLGHPSQTQTHELGDAAQVSCLMRLVVLSAIASNLMNKMPTWKSGRFARSKRKYTEKCSCK